MDFTTFGRTKLRVSVAGLGCGGFSRLGLGTGNSPEQAEAIVRSAIEHGVNFMDTAPVYGTEAIVGRAMQGHRRDQLVIATKAGFGRDPVVAPPETIVASLDNSLRVLGTDYIDVFQLHAIQPRHYLQVREQLLPALQREQQKGKFRFLGITETAPLDHHHEMAQQAIPDGHWDSLMLAYHLLHQNARNTVFPLTRQHGVGTLLMFVVRGIFAQPERLATTLRELALPPLDFLLHPDGASTMMDAAYRFVRHELGVDVVLFGTGDLDHLHTNMASLLKPPLPASDVATLKQVYGHVVGVGLDVPTATKSKS